MNNDDLERQARDAKLQSDLETQRLDADWQRTVDEQRERDEREREQRARDDRERADRAREGARRENDRIQQERRDYQERRPDAEKDDAQRTAARAQLVADREQVAALNTLSNKDDNPDMTARLEADWARASERAQSEPTRDGIDATGARVRTMQPSSSYASQSERIKDLFAEKPAEDHTQLQRDRDR